MEDHQLRTIAISRAVKSFHEQKVPFRIYHGSTNSTRIIALDPSKVVDTSNMSNIIDVNTSRQIATVEPNVPMDALVAATLKQGFLPPVIPEFKGITAGGAFAGTAGESSSFRHGFFDRSVTRIEIVLADGRVWNATPEVNSDLYHGAVGACGTLGVITLLEIQLIPAKKYVEVTYKYITDGIGTGVCKATRVIEQNCALPDVNFVDGIVFDPKFIVIMVGRLVNKPRSKQKIQRFTRAHDPWFYLHAYNKHRPGQDYTECIPIQDYLFRYDRGAFWMGMYSFDGIGFNRFTRWLVNPLMNTRKLYQQMHHSGTAQRCILQDLAIPLQNTEQLVQYVIDNFAICPLWLCPLRADSKAPLHKMPGENGMIINIGVWGPGPGYGTSEAEYERFKADNREIERKVMQLGGMKWLYAHTYYTEDEFWQIYDRKGYENVRKKYGAEGLPSLYDKVKAATKYWPVGKEWRGAVKSVLGRNHLMAMK